jgi:hypothetical protein
MTTDDVPSMDDDGVAAEASVAGPLRTLLAAHVDDAIATDETWAAIELEAGERRARRSRRRAVALAAVSVAAVLVLILVMRLDGADDEGQVTVGPEPEEPGRDPLEGTEPDSWVRLLGHVPSGAVEEAPLWLVDLRRAREQAGVSALAGGASADAWRAQSQATFGSDNILLSPLGHATPEEVRAELGFGPEQFDQVVVIYGGLPRYVAAGRFNRAAIAAAVSADPLWGPDLRVREEGGVTVYAWGEDGMRLTQKRSPMRDLGTGGRLVVGDGWLAWCYTDDEVAALVAAAADPRTSAAADDPIREAVEAGDDALLTQLIVTPGDLPERSTTPTLPPPLPELEPIDQPLVWSGGSTRSPAGSVEHYRLGYRSDAQAAANLDAYRQNWERFAGDLDLRVEQRGSGLVATVLLSPAADGVGVVGELSDGTTQRLNAGSFVLYLNLTGGA